MPSQLNNKKLKKQLVKYVGENPGASTQQIANHLGIKESRIPIMVTSIERNYGTLFWIDFDGFRTVYGIFDGRDC